MAQLCRMPCLRHSPLRELQKMAPYMQQVTLAPGEGVVLSARGTAQLGGRVKQMSLFVCDKHHTRTTNAVLLSAAKVVLLVHVADRTVCRTVVHHTCIKQAHKQRPSVHAPQPLALHVAVALLDVT